MISRPAFKAHLRVVPIPGEGALLLSERETFVLRGDVWEHLVQLVDGARSADEIVAALAGTVDSAAAWYGLLRLEAAGHIVEHDAVGRAGAFWPALGADPVAAAATFAAASVRIFAAGTCGVDLAERLAAALLRFGIGAPATGSIDPAAVPAARSDVDVVLTDDYLGPALPHFDRTARETRQEWLPVRPTGVELWIGPLFRPGGPGCLHCLRHRLVQRRPACALAARHDPAHGARMPAGTASVTAEAGCMLAATEIAKALAGVGPDLAGAMWSFDLGDRSSRMHRLVPDPACPVCGAGPRRRQAEPLSLQPRRVAFDTEGGLRTVAPEVVLDTYEHLVSPIIGVVGSFTPAPGADGLGRHYLADDLSGGRTDTLHQLRQRFRSGSAGKGISRAQARASALGEALERYSGQLRGTELRIPGTFRELGGDAIHPNRVANYSERQYRERDAWNARGDARHHVPEPFDPEARIDWTPVWSLTEERHKLLPTELLYYGPGSETDKPRRPRFCSGDTNGCASGSVLEEAVLQGFLELVERDAVAMWWYNRVRRPAVDPGSFDDPWLSAIGLRYQELDRDVVALDLTHDLGIPVFAGLSHCRRGARERILIGFGCHLDARIALQRALTEMCQMLSVDLAGEPRVIKEMGDGWLDWATRADLPYLVPDDTQPVRTRDDFPSLGCEDLLDCIRLCRGRVEAHGMEMLALDQTRADIGMPVAKVVVPGLRHFWARFGPGRLYDVPVALGWLPAPVAEEELNPIPFFW